MYMSLAMSCHGLEAECKDWWRSSANRYASNSQIQLVLVMRLQDFPLTDKTTVQRQDFTRPSQSSQDLPGSCWELATASAVIAVVAMVVFCKLTRDGRFALRAVKRIPGSSRNCRLRRPQIYSNLFRFGFTVIWIVWSGQALLCFTHFTGTEEAWWGAEHCPKLDVEACRSGVMLHHGELSSYCSYLLPIKTQGVKCRFHHDLVSDEDMSSSPKLYFQESLENDGKWCFFCTFLTGTVGPSWPHSYPFTGMASKKTCCVKGTHFATGVGYQIWSGVSGWSVTWHVWIFLFLTFWLVRTLCNRSKICWCQLMSIAARFFAIVLAMTSASKATVYFPCWSASRAHLWSSSVFYIPWKEPLRHGGHGRHWYVQYDAIWCLKMLFFWERW